MSIQLVSTDDTILHHDSDFDNLSNMSSPVLSEFSDIMAPTDNGRDDLPVFSLDLFDNNLINPELPVDMLPALDSFAPITELLPSFALKNNTYHADQPLLKAELQQLRSYTRRIRELTLTDTESTNYPNVAPETLSRLALIQDPKSPFLPSLESLHLVGADKALGYLFFCITPSLATLEISQIPLSHHVTIAYFLQVLVLNVPQLSNITFGPGRLSESSLQSSLKFVHLRQLHILDAADSLDFEFLRNVSLLPELESFNIDARTAEYKQRISSSDANSSAPTNSSMGSPPPVEIRPPITNNVDSAIPFRQLTKLVIVANLVLMGDLVYYLFPQKVKKISLTLVQNGQALQLPSHWDKKRIEASARNDAATVTDDSGIPEPDALTFQVALGSSVANPPVPDAQSYGTLNSLPYSMSTNPAAPQQEAIDPLAMLIEQAVESLDDVPPKPSVSRCKKHTKRKSTSHCGQCLKMEADNRRRVEKKQELARLEAEEEEMQRLRATEEWLNAERQVREEEERISNVISQTAYFAYVIEEILTVGDPDAFLIDLLEMASRLDFAPITSSLEFPSPTFRMLLSCPTLRELQLYHWTLPSVDKSFVDLAATPSTLLMSVEKLQLPVDASLNSGIMISTLHQVACYYPRLTYLECLIQQLPAETDSVFDLGARFIPHGLETLSVGGGSPSTKDKVNISTYLSLHFPKLKAIKTHKGYDEDDWKYIHTLVKMCQTVSAARLDEQLRRQGAQ